MKESFGQFLATKRKAQGYTQKELAGLLYVSESTISKWEKDVANPDITMIPNICKILKVSEHELITASEDNEQKTINKNAKKWTALVTTWDLFFIISYGITILTCFIVNLATSGTLDWFWIVFASIVFAASFTTMPKYIKKYKLLLYSTIPLILMFIMLGVICIYTQGDWLFVTIFPIILGFIMVFFPIYVAVYNFPNIAKKHNAIISFILDYILLFVMLLVINEYTAGNWVFNFALPIISFCAILPLVIILVIRYLRINKYLKTSIILFVSTIISIFTNPLVQTLLLKTMGKTYLDTYLPNFAIWSGDYTGNNVIFMINIILFLLCVVFLIVGLNKRKK